MFDKLIESNSAEAEFKPRRKFFMMSSVVVGIMFLTAVVISLYAQDIDLGTNDFELVRMLAPIEPDVPEPEPPQEQPERTIDQDQTTELPNRPELIARLDQNVKPPETISTVPNTVKEIPDSGKFLNDVGRPESDGRGSTGPASTVPGGTGSGTSEIASSEVVKATDPPPIPPKVETPKRTVSLGAVNGLAKYLPKPQYPSPALAIRAGGPVTVQVTIDEEGNVISAKALSGHPLLLRVSEIAARSAKFTPTTLSKVPVKVTGVITYNFTRQ